MLRSCARYGPPTWSASATPGKTNGRSCIARIEKNGPVTPLVEGPNGLAFSPDEKHVYVTNWDPQKKIVMRCRSLCVPAALTGVVAVMAAAPVPAAGNANPWIERLDPRPALQRSTVRSAGRVR